MADPSPVVVREGSPPGTLAKQDWKSIGINTGLAVLAAVLAYFGDVVIPGLNNPLLVPVLLAVIKAAQKWISDTQTAVVQEVKHA